MSGFRDAKLKTPLTTRWAQMSKQEQIIERKKIEIQAKLEAQKQAAALAAQAKLVSGNSKVEGKTNIFRNDGSFMNQFKALLEKQKQQKAEEERAKFEAVEKENRAQAEATEKHQLEGITQEDSLDLGRNNSHENNQQSSEKERSEESQQDTKAGEVDPESQDKKHIPSLMQLPMMPPGPSTDENNQNMQSGPPNIPPFMTGVPPNFQGPLPGQPPFMGSNIAGTNVGPPDFASNSSGLGFGPNGPATSFGPNSSNFESNSSHGFSPNAPGSGFGPNGPGPGFGPNGPGFGPNGPGFGPNGPGPGFGPNGPGPGFGPNGPGPGFGPNGPGPGFGPNGPGSGFRPNGPGQGFGPNFRGPMGPNGPPFFAPFPNRPPFNGGPNMPPFPPSRGPPFNGGPNGPPFNSGPPFMGGPNMPFNGPNNPFNAGPNRQQFNNFNSNRPPFNTNNNRPPFDDISQFDSGAGSFNGPPVAGPIGSQKTCQMPNVPTSNNAPNFMPPSSMCLNNIPEPKALDSVKIPPPNPMSMQNIPPPLPVSQRPSTKEMNYDSNRQSSSQVLSADMDADIAARDAALHWRNTGRLPDLRQYSALWFINDVTSSEYRKFRELIQKYKNAPDEDSRELKSEDKYDPEFSLEDDDSNDDFKQNFNTNESNNCFKEDKFAFNFKQENYDSNDSFKNVIYNSCEKSKKDNFDSNDSFKTNIQIQNNISDRSLAGGHHFNYKEESSSQDGNKIFEDGKDMKREYASSQSDEEEENKKERRRKKKSRWGDSAADVSTVVTLSTIEMPSMDSMPPMPPMPPMPGMLPVPGMPPVPAMPPVPTLPPVPAMPPMPPMPPMPSKPSMPPMPKTEPIQLTSVNRSNPALVQYAITNYGTTNLSPEDWKKCEDNFKLNLLYQDMMKKRQELERLAAAGKFKYEYDSDEDTDNGTWEHKLRSKEMNATERWATELTKQATGKHHIGDFLPPEELKKFMEKYSAAKGGEEPNLSDYKEYKLKEDNVGFKMLQKLGWTEGKGLGAAGTGIVEPVNKAAQAVANAGLGAASADDVSAEDDEFDAYRKRMMLAYRFRPNPLNNPRRPYY